MEKSPSAFQTPNTHQTPGSPVEDEDRPAVPPKGSPPPTKRLDSQTPPSTTASQARPGTPDFFLANSNYSMPGAYPSTRDVSPSPPSTDPRTQSTKPPSPYTPKPSAPLSSKRRGSTSSIKHLLAGLRRPSGNSQPALSNNSPEGSPTPTNRPATPSQESMASSERPLRKKMSGSLWTRRKSSLGVEVLMDAGGQGQTQNYRNSPNSSVRGQNDRSASPQALPSPSSPKDSIEAGSIMSSIRNRKSGTFWGKRKTSMGMESKPNSMDTGPDNVFQGHARTTSTASGPSSVDQSPPRPLQKKKSASFWKRKASLDTNRASTPAQYNSNGSISSPTQPIRENEAGDGEDSRLSEADSYVPVARSESPPPKLPELNLGLGGGTGNGFLKEADDMFASIGKD